MLGNAKGADVIYLRKRLRAIGDSAEQAFISHLTPEEAKYYQTAVPLSWVPIEVNAKLQKQAAAILFPNQIHGVQQLGREQAKEDLGGIYRVLIRIVTIPALLKQLSNLWKTYNNKGILKADSFSDKNTGILIIEEYPEYPKVSLANVDGYIQGCLEMAGAKNIRVITDYRDPQAWRFHVSWE